MADVQRAGIDAGARSVDGYRAPEEDDGEDGDDVYVSSDEEGAMLFDADVQHISSDDSDDSDESEDSDDDPSGGNASSSDSDAEERNTVGDVPMRWYDDYEHIGYDRAGERIARKPRSTGLERLVRGDADDWRVIYDERNDEHVRVSDEELALVLRIRNNSYPGVASGGSGGSGDGEARTGDEEEFIAWARGTDGTVGGVEKHPLFNGTEPRRRFEPSRHEAAKLVELVRGLREGRIKTLRERIQAANAARSVERYHYDVWTDSGTGAPDDGDEEEGDDDAGRGSGAGFDAARRRVSKSARARSLMHVAPPKPPLPGHAESYNPPAEYLPTEPEAEAWRRAHPEDRRLPYLPQKFSSLRRVPAYEHFVRERFERCLDLYLCPRVVRQRVQIDDPDTLLPELPSPRELRPFPSRIALRYVDRSGNGGRVRCMSVHPRCGQWLATGSDDGCVRVWDVMSGRLLRRWSVGRATAAADSAPAADADSADGADGHDDESAHRQRPPEPQRRAIADVKWVPGMAAPVLAVACDNRVCLVLACNDALYESAVAAPAGADESGGTVIESLLPRRGDATVDIPRGVRWTVEHVGEEVAGASAAIVIEHPKRVKQLAVHKRGDYLSVVAGDMNGNTVYVHQISRRQSQLPFRKRMSQVQCAVFHPSKPFFLVATQHHIRVYSLAKQALARKLMPGVRWISCMAVHPGGDNLICGSYDKRLCWFDLDLGATPYRVLRNHRLAVRDVCFHERAPLFASASDDGAVHVFHGMVYDDLSKDPLLVPVRVLHGHRVVKGLGTLAAQFHPEQPWLFSAGADGQIVLWVDE